MKNNMLTIEQKQLMRDFVYRSAVKLSIRDLGAKNAEQNARIFETILRATIMGMSVAWGIDFNANIQVVQEILTDVIREVMSMTQSQLIALNYHMMRGQI